MKIDSITYEDAQNCFCFTVSTGRKYFVSYEAYMALQLHKNHELTEVERQALIDEDAHVRAFLIALRYARYQPRTEQEVRRRLRREHLPEKEIEEAILKLTQQHLLDDEGYAFQYAEEKQSLRTWSRNEIAQHLYQKGISSEQVQRVFEAMPQESEQEALEKLFQKKYARRDLTDSKEFERTFRALARHGFSTSDILSLLRETRDEPQSEDFK